MTTAHINSWSETEKDEVAAMVLAVVREVVAKAPRGVCVRRTNAQEPTGIRVDADMAEFVLKRSAS